MVIFAIEELECIIRDSVQLFCLVLFVVAWKFWVVLGAPFAFRNFFGHFWPLSTIWALCGTLGNMSTLSNTFLMGGSNARELSGRLGEVLACFFADRMDHVGHGIYPTEA